MGRKSARCFALNNRNQQGEQSDKRENIDEVVKLYAARQSEYFPLLPVSPIHLVSQHES